MPTYIPGPTANTDMRELHQAVGEALSTWSHVEMQLVVIFHHAMGAEDLSTSYDMFRSVVNFNARLLAVHNVVKRTLRRKKRPDELDRWNKLYVRADDLVDDRNAIAHGRVACICDRPGLDGIQPHLGVRLSDPIRCISKGLTPKQVMHEGYDLMDVKTAAEAFHKLGYDLFMFDQDWMHLDSESVITPTKIS